MADTTSANGGSGVTGAVSSVTNGPVAQSVKDQQAKTAAEFSNLAASRQTPPNPAATGQPLTHYHSLFSELLSWNNPRASAIAYVSIATLIFAVRYLDVLRWSLKLTWMILATTVAAEVVGKSILSTGFASQLRPRKYYTLSRESFDAVLGDLHELANFFVIETQRIVFVENVSVSVAACVAAFISYYLVKIVPYWGLALTSTTIAFVAPLIYKSNKELIDHHLKQASDIVNAQTSQLKEVAGKHTAQMTEATKQALGDYTGKAQQLLSRRSVSPEASPVKPTPAAPASKEYVDTDFPAAPKQDLKTEEPVIKTEKAEEEPLLA